MGGNTILVWGAGAIGGTVGAHLARAGHDVLLVDRAADHVGAIAEHGLAITGPVTEFTVPVRAATPDQVQGRFETVLLCVKAQDTEGAARALLPHLADNGCVVSLQNGLNERVIAEVVGPERTWRDAVRDCPHQCLDRGLSGVAAPSSALHRAPA